MHRSTRTSHHIIPRSLSRSFRRSKKRAVRGVIVASNLALIIGVMLFVLHNPSSGSVQQSAANSIANTQAMNPLDTVSSADIAVYVALMTNLPEKKSVTNHADSVKTQLMAAITSNEVVTKPQIMSAKIKTKDDIQEYTVQSGEDLGAVASKFGVTSESIKWSNSLTSTTGLAGKKLLVPPVNGFIYTVKSGDTPDNLAQKYNSNKDKIITFNDAEISGLKVGNRIVIPDGMVPAPAYVPPAYLSGYAWGDSAIYGSNGYDYGWCTWWAAKRRADIGRAIPANLGDAYTWVSRARLAGLNISNTPTQGAVIWSNTYYPGHVGFVEEVEADGSAWITDMNSHGQVSKTNTAFAGGWNRTSWRHVTPSQFGGFKFIL